ncbi:MAG: 50S ribosomal protein L34e [Promethearchaeota archaeon]
MPRGQYRSRRFARNKIRIPGNRVVLHYHKKNPTRAHCSVCGAPLPGVPRLRDAKKRNLPKTRKRPSRPYSGNLCSKCLRSYIKKSVF